MSRHLYKVGDQYVVADHEEGQEPDSETHTEIKGDDLRKYLRSVVKPEDSDKLEALKEARDKNPEDKQASLNFHRQRQKVIEQKDLCDAFKVYDTEGKVISEVPEESANDDEREKIKSARSKHAKRKQNK